MNYIHDISGKQFCGYDDKPFLKAGKQKCGFILIENQILNCLIVELTNCRKNDK